jgi:hypothetical protein
MPVPLEPDVGARSAAEFAQLRKRGSGNNSSLVESAQTSPDVESCLAAIRVLQQGLPRAAGGTASAAACAPAPRRRLEAEHRREARRCHRAQVPTAWLTTSAMSLLGVTKK